MAKLLLFLIRAYQLSLSYILGRQCRFMPTCSTYAAEAIKRFGAKEGGRLAWRRFCKCHPFSRHHGFDPVPEKAPETTAEIPQNKLPASELDKRSFRAINPNQL